MSVSLVRRIAVPLRIKLETTKPVRTGHLEKEQDLPHHLTRILHIDLA